MYRWQCYNLLRSNQTPKELKASQVANTSAKVLKIASKAAGFENTYTPNQDWNTKLDTDMLRHEKSRSLESDEARKVRRQKRSSCLSILLARDLRIN